MIRYENSCDCCGKPVKTSVKGDLVSYKEYKFEIDELNNIHSKIAKNKINTKTEFIYKILKIIEYNQTLIKNVHSYDGKRLQNENYLYKKLIKELLWIKHN